MHGVETLDDYANKEVENEDMTHDHVNDEVADIARIRVDFRLQVDTSTIYSLVHDTYPAFVSHENHKVENPTQEVIEVCFWILPRVAQVQTVLLCLYSVIILG